MTKFKEGDTVRLVSLSIHRAERENWLLREKAAGLKVQLQREYTVEGVDYDTPVGWISCLELNHFHPADKFELVKRAKRNTNVYETTDKEN